MSARFGAALRGSRASKKKTRLGRIGAAGISICCEPCFHGRQVALIFQGDQELANISSSMLSVAQSRYTFLHSRHQTRRQRLGSPRRHVNLCPCCFALLRAICARHHLLRERHGKRFEQRNLDQFALSHHQEGGRPYQTRRHRERDEWHLRPFHYFARGVSKRRLHHLSGVSGTASYGLKERQHLGWHPNLESNQGSLLYRCRWLHHPRQRPRHYGQSGPVGTGQE